ncbi:hypothetical protein [Citricoccus sp.]|uniref:hypothetical protein n=1 Tax=Citricoccus sp. TaxID=1978372 RepID=UPI0028BE909B|nr:hypothetical protein [Citricoccus sp.]
MSQTDPASTDPELKKYRSLRDALLWVAGMLLLTYLSSVLTLPWKAVSLGFALAGLVWGVVALLRTAHVKSPGVLRFATAAAMAGCATFGFVASAQIVFWDATEQFEECTSSALTDRALENCSSTYTERLGGTALPGAGIPLRHR